MSESSGKSRVHVNDALGNRLRSKRIAPLLEMIDDVFARKGSVRIIDVGGTADYWNLVPAEFLDSRNVHITIVNFPGGARGEAATKRITHEYGDGCDLVAYRDKEFDISHSNSVLEHVGTWSKMSMFAKELSRVAEQYFVQTPNFWFPIEPHFMVPFFHWLPEPTRVWILRRFTLGGRWRLGANSIDEAVRLAESARLLSRAMFAELFGDAEIRAERFMLLTKSFVAIRRTAPATAARLPADR
jgi:hypothetical protein